MDISEVAWKYRKDGKELVGATERREQQQGNAAHGETCKLHHQLPNEGSLNRSSGTHNHSSYRRASAAGLRSATLMVIDGALSQRKCLSYTTGRCTASKTTPSCENTPSSAVAAKWGNQMPQDWSFEILQIFYALFSHVWIPRIPAKRQGREKKASLKFLQS